MLKLLGLLMLGALWSLGAGLATLGAGEGAEPKAAAGEEEVQPPLDLPPPPDATAEGGGTAGEEATAEAEGGRPGQITAARVNVRAGPSTRYEIIVTLNEKAPVRVYAKVGDWLKTGYPPGQFVYLHEQYVDGDIPPNIPREGLSLTIAGAKVRVRVRPWNRSTVVGFVNQGDTVVVTGIRGPWLRIKPPATVRAWVFAKLVKYRGKVALDNRADVPKRGEVPESPAVKKKERDQEIADKLDRLIEKRRQEEEARQEAERRSYEAAKQKIVAEIDAEMRRIDADVAREKESIRAEFEAKRRSPVADFYPGAGVTGWVEYIGRAGRRPAAYRLVKGGEVIYLLRSKKHILADYQHRRVIVDGAVELAPGFEANVLIVESIQILGQPPKSVDTKVGERHPWRPFWRRPPKKKEVPPATPKEAVKPATKTAGGGEDEAGKDGGPGEDGGMIPLEEGELE